MLLLAAIVRQIGRLYPFYSGYGTVANLLPFRLLDPPGGKDGWVPVTGGRAFIPAGDLVGRSMRFMGDLDPKVSWVVDRAVRRGDVVLDIGANLGLLSLRLAAAVGRTGKVHAFEPQPRLQRYLAQTFAANPDLPVELHGVALGNVEGELEMAVPRHNAGAATISGRNRPGDERFMVPVRRLDSMARDLGLDRVDFVKIDVEGFEAEVLAGGLEFLARTRPRAILLEENGAVRPDSLPPALALVERLGYHLFALPRRLLSVRLEPLTASGRAHDFLALSPETPADILTALSLPGPLDRRAPSGL
jgi:FkbM family methyltransferase